MKFGRFYTMFAQGANKEHQIDYPLTCRFQVTNDNTFTLGKGVFQIYNLSADVRADLYKDPLDILTYKQVVFAAGYIKDSVNPITIFKGNIQQCYSYRQGPDWITEIIGADGDYAQSNSTIDLSIKDGYTLRYAIQQLVNAFSPTVQLGLIGNQVVTSVVANTRGLSLSGNPFDLLSRQCSSRSLLMFLYQEKCNVLSLEEYVASAGGVTEISEETGILGSPQLGNFIVTARMIFEPKLIPQQKVQLKVVEKRMSRDYIVGRVVHRGTISGALCENLETEATLYRPVQELRAAA